MTPQWTLYRREVNTVMSMFDVRMLVLLLFIPSESFLLWVLWHMYRDRKRRPRRSRWI